MTLNFHEIKRIHIFVTGKVQGVGFRAFVQNMANRLGLYGWVRNVGYNQVEIVAEGTPEVLDVFVKGVRTGPRSGRVNDLNLSWETPIGNMNKFEIRFD